MKKKSRQQIQKLYDKKCYFCEESEYKLLDCHRIVEGKDGGTYHPRNTLTVCCKCHRKIHTGIIKIHGRYFTSKGKWVVHYTENGEEGWR